MNKFVGQEVTAQFSDGKTLCGRVLSVDLDLGVMTITWDDGPRSWACTFKIDETLIKFS